MRPGFNDRQRQQDANLLMQACNCFNQHVENEQDAANIIFRLLFGNKSSICPCCHGNNVFRKNGSRTVFCLNCKTESWFTSNSFFDGVRKPRAYLLAIWLMECGLSFSANSFAKHAKVSYDTAWTILKKLDMVIEAKLVNHGVLAFSSHFRELFLKRSRETPARKDPAFEQDEFETREAEENSSAQIDPQTEFERTGEDEQLNEVEQQVLDLITIEKLDIDAILDRTGLNISQVSLALTMLELADRIKQNFGGRFEALPKRKTKIIEELSSGMKALIKEVSRFIRNSMHGISRKYLQLYLARFWCLTDKTNWGRGELLSACITASRISKSDILEYVSPLLINVHIPGTNLFAISLR